MGFVNFSFFPPLSLLLSFFVPLASLFLPPSHLSASSPALLLLASLPSPALLLPSHCCTARGTPKPLVNIKLRFK